MDVSQSLQRGRTFGEQLAFGQVAETDIAKWIIRRGGWVVPIYEVEYHRGKGPRVFACDIELVAPDLLVVRNGRACWIEAKHKSVFTWHRKTGRWTTGIDLHHYEQYIEVQERIEWPVWLLFLHRRSTPDNRDKPHCPPKCPTGLFGQALSNLTGVKNENHRHENWGRSGMVYWSVEKLKPLATLKELGIA